MRKSQKGANRIANGTENSEPSNRFNEYNILIQTSLDGFCVCDLSGRLTDCNAALCQMLGYEREELLSLSIKHMNASESPDELKLHMQHTRKTGNERFQARLKRKDGAYLEAEIHTQYVEALGERFFVFIRDITERIHAEEALALEKNMSEAILNAKQALRGSEERFRSFFQESPIGIELYNGGGFLLDANPACLQIFGIEHMDDIKQFNCFDDPNFPEDAKKNVRLGRIATYEAVFDFDLIRQLDLYQTKKSGKIYVHSMVFPWHAEDGQPGGYFVQVMDITEQKTAQDALQESQRRLATLMSNLPGMAYRCKNDPEWTMEFVSEGCVRLTGYTSDELLHGTHSSPVNLIHPDDREMVWGSIQASLAQREPYELNYRIITASGEEKWVWELGQGVYDSGGNVEALEGFSADITRLKQSEEALRQNDAMLNRIFEILPVGLWISDKNGQLIRNNKKGQEIWDWNPLTEISRSEAFKARLLKTGEMVDSHDTALDRTIREKTTILDEMLEIETFTRQKKIILNSTTPVLDDAGEVEAAVLINVDITERIQMENALRESEKRYHAYVDFAPLGIFVTDETGVFLEVNAAGCALPGYEKTELAGMKFTDLLDPSQLEAGLEHFRRLKEQRPVTSELLHRRKNGEKRWWSVCGMALSPTRFMAICTDITDKKNDEATIQRFKTIFDLASFGAAMVTLDGSIVYINNYFAEIHGYQRDELVGKDLSILYSAESMDKLDKNLTQLLQKGQIDGFEINDRHKDGFEFPMLLKGLVLKDETGAPVYIAITAEDIRERKRAEHEIHTLNNELERRVTERTAQLAAANKELEAFSYSVSHDLRAPLRGIDGWSQALLEDYSDELDEQAQTYLHRVRFETQRMGKLIDDVLQLSRLTRSEMRNERVDLGALAQTVVERLKESEPDRRVDIVIGTGLIARGDPRLLELALSNLFGNSFKFTGKTPNARIEFGQITLQQEAVFFIRDNGVGFDMAYAAKLFSAFTRLHKPSEFPGTGIGLATVQRIIHRHGGRVWAEAHVNQGATFFFTLGEIS